MTSVIIEEARISVFSTGMKLKRNLITWRGIPNTKTQGDWWFVGRKGEHRAQFQGSLHDSNSPRELWCRESRRMWDNLNLQRIESAKKQHHQLGIKFAFIYCKLIVGADSNELTDLKAEINQDIEAAGGDGGRGQDPLVDPPHRVLDHGRDPRARADGAQLHLLQAGQHLGGGLSIPQYVRPWSEEKYICRWGEFRKKWKWFDSFKTWTLREHKICKAKRCGGTLQ